MSDNAQKRAIEAAERRIAQQAAIDAASRRLSEKPALPPYGAMTGLNVLGDVAKNMAGGAGNAIFAGSQALAGLPLGMDFAANRANQQMENPLVEPKYQATENILSSVAKPFEAFSSSADTIAENFGRTELPLVTWPDARFIQRGEPIPAAQTAIRTGIEGAPELLGAKTRFKPAGLTARVPRFQAKGYKIDPVATNPSSGMARAEGFGGVQDTRRAASVHNQQVTNRLIREELGLPEGAEISVTELSALRAVAGESYEAIRNAGRLFADKRFFDDVDRSVSGFTNAIKDFPDLAKQLGSEVQDMAKAVKMSQFDASSAVDVLKQLRNKADIAYRQGDNVSGLAYRDMANAMEDVIDRQLSRSMPEGLERFRAARQQIAKTHSVQDALDGSDVNARNLAAQLKKGKPLSGNIKLVAEFAQDFPKIARVIKENVKPMSRLDAALIGTSIPLPFILQGLFDNPLATLPGLAPAAVAAGGPTLRNLALGPLGQRAARQGPRNPYALGAGIGTSGLLAYKPEE